MMSEAEVPQFEEDLIRERTENEQLLLYLGGFDGPIDMLLSLARDQKVDLTTISILALANQYLDFIEKARSVRLELAADYLVMAAWLAYLKSRLLIPQEEQKQAEPSAQDLADALQFQLRRLEAMRKVANDLFNLPRLGVNVFGRGEPDGLPVKYVAKYDMTYYDLLKAYGDVKQRQQNSVYKLEPVRLFSLEEAIDRMTGMLGKVPEEWVSLFMFLPGGLDGKIVKRSAIASTFGGALEMVKRGLLELQQEQNYATIYIRKPVPKDGQAAPVGEDAGNGLSEAAEAALDDSFDEPIDPSQTVEAEMEADEEARAAERLKEHLAQEEETGTGGAEDLTEDETSTLNKEAAHHGED
jgi:segregation and condensation protein A